MLTGAAGPKRVDVRDGRTLFELIARLRREYSVQISDSLIEIAEMRLISDLAPV